MDKPYLLDKPLGATPLQTLDVLRVARSIPPSVKLSYAGRLDPLATGLMPVLYGDMLTRQEEYWYLAKQYEASVLLGIESDSYDLLGLSRASVAPTPDPERVTATVRGLVGKIDLSVPIYSSHRVEGKALFAWARSVQDGPPAVPVRRMTVSQIDVSGMTEISSEQLRDLVAERIGLVRGDFRQQEALGCWGETLHGERYFPLVHLNIRCGSGTYIRSLAHEIGRRLGCGALVAGLRRTQVGPWRVDDPEVIGLSWPQ